MKDVENKSPKNVYITHLGHPPISGRVEPYPAAENIKQKKKTPPTTCNPARFYEHAIVIVLFPKPTSNRINRWHWTMPNIMIYEHAIIIELFTKHTSNRITRWHWYHMQL